MKIGENYNYDDNFIRMVNIALCKTLSTRIRWINRWNDGKKIRVVLPFYLSFAGQERFLLDAFVDDVASTRVELNADQKQRGVITFKGSSHRSDEFANPNQYISKNFKLNNELKNLVSRTMAVPLSLNYEIMIKLDSELEVYTCYEKILDTLFNYRFFNISYFGLKIDAFFSLPNDSGIEIPREINISSDNNSTIKFSLEVKTYYPIFKFISDDFEICDNDDQIDWDFLGIKRPTGNDISSSDGALKRVHFYHNLINRRSLKDIIRENEDNKNNEINNME